MSPNFADRLSRREVLVGAGTAVALSLLKGPVVMGRGRASVSGPPAATRTPKIIETEWIGMPDGAKLAARIILPEDAEQRPVGAVFEYYPYRRRDWFREQDNKWGRQLAARGFALVRVDIRGSGDSDGIIEGEYLQPEQSDAVSVIQWIASQPWCNGSVGMRGASWGAFSALHAAWAAPKELKAIISVCGSENRYLEDSHYLGGAVMIDNFIWGTMFDLVAIGPPDPEVVGSRWREMWQQRLNSAGPNANRWLHHQYEDAFWKFATYTQNDYERINCPIYIVDGLTDPYVNQVPRLLSRMRCPRKAIVGPWGHAYPDGKPGPSLDWILEETRWWDRWLNGRENGIMQEPTLRAFVAHAAPAQQYPQDTPGHWISEQSWPSAAVTPKTYYVSATGLTDHPVRGPILPYKSRQTVGLKTVWWVPTIMEQELPQEQSDDDKLSLVFDSPVLGAPLEILGNPIARLRVRADAPVAKVVVRLTELDASGKSWLVSYGVLNLTHRMGHEHPALLAPGEDYDVEIPLYFTARRFAKGSRIRVAISEGLWPLLWPSPTAVTLGITPGASQIQLPIRNAPHSEDHGPPIPQLARPTAAEPPAEAKGGANGLRTEIQGPEERRTVRITQDDPYGRQHLQDINLDIDVFHIKIDHRITEGDPTSAMWSGEVSCSWNRSGWNVEIHSSFELRSTASDFELRESIKAVVNEEVALEKVWSDRIKRQFV